MVTINAEFIKALFWSQEEYSVTSEVLKCCQRISSRWFVCVLALDFIFVITCCVFFLIVLLASLKSGCFTHYSTKQKQYYSFSFLRIISGGGGGSLLYWLMEDMCVTPMDQDTI